MDRPTFDMRNFTTADTSDSSAESSTVTTAATTPAATSPGTFAGLLAEHNLTEPDLFLIRNQLITIARTASRMIMDADPSVNSSDEKKNSSDRVTATDRAVENMVQTTLATLYPTLPFLGEETTKESQKLTDEPTFVCDPIDGTLNFIHGFPNTAVSLALTIGRKPVVGVVLNPFRGELFTAVKHQGAFLMRADGETLRLPIAGVPGPLPNLNACLVGLEWGSQRSGLNWHLRLHMTQALLSSPSHVPPSGSAVPNAMVHSIRSSGSTALDFCYVAAGTLDVFWEGGCWIWDVCAGWIILEEAGGIVASANPGNWDPELEGRLYLAVRGAKRYEQEGVVREMWKLMGDQRFRF
jgi:myo-inositol-1(or 4)-monophosphatase